MKKNILIDGKPVPFVANGATPWRYRARFHEDIFKDISRLTEDFSKAQVIDGNGSVSLLEIDSLEAFEKIAYIMAKQADPDIPDDPAEWLERFEFFSIYEVLPEILGLWNLNLEQKSEVKKNIEKQIGR